MAREMRPNDAYAEFASNFEESIGSAIFLEPKVKVYPLQTNGGKSHYQDKEMPLELKQFMNFLLMVAPGLVLLQIPQVAIFSIVLAICQILFYAYLVPTHTSLQILKGC